MQLPLPKHLQTQRILDLVAFHKDVDGLSSHNQELLRHNLPSYLGYPRFTPCAPLAVLEMLQAGKISLEGKKGTEPRDGPGSHRAGWRRRRRRC